MPILWISLARNICCTPFEDCGSSRELCCCGHCRRGLPLRHTRNTGWVAHQTPNTLRSGRCCPQKNVFFALRHTRYPSKIGARSTKPMLWATVASALGNRKESAKGDWTHKLTLAHGSGFTCHLTRERGGAWYPMASGKYMRPPLLGKRWGVESTKRKTTSDTWAPTTRRNVHKKVQPKYTQYTFKYQK